MNTPLRSPRLPIIVIIVSNRGHLENGKADAEQRKSPVMRPTGKWKALTFGDFITRVYDLCGRRKAAGIVKLAVNAHFVAFRGQLCYVVS